MEPELERKGLFAEAKLLNSVKAEQGAARLLEKIDNVEMVMEVLPNTSEQYSGEHEERNYVSYCRFLNSANGKKVLHMLEAEDAGKCVKL